MGKLHAAFRMGGSIKLLRELANGADPNETDELGIPILCDAAAAGDIDAINLLVDSGADIEGAGSHGWTPLILAANAGKEEAVRLLLSRGANAAAETTEGYKAHHRVPNNCPSLQELLRNW